MNSRTRNFKRMYGLLLKIDKKISLNLLITIFTIGGVYYYFYFKAYLSEIIPVETINDSFELILGYLLHVIYVYFGMYLLFIFIIIIIIMLYIIYILPLFEHNYVSIFSIFIKFIFAIYIIIIFFATNSNEIKNGLGKLYFNISVNSGIFKEKKSNKVIFSYGKDADGIVYYCTLNDSEIGKIVKNYKNLDIKKFSFFDKNINIIEERNFLNNYRKLYCIKMEKNSCECKPNKCISILKKIIKDKS